MTGNTFDKSKMDHALAVVKAAANVIPWAGGPLGSLLSDYLPDSVESRKTKLLLELAEDLNKLVTRFNDDALTTDVFITTFIKAFRQAVETHQQEKVDAFRAIILNTLINHAPNEDEISIVLNITERLTPLHIKMLKILATPDGALELNQEDKAKSRFVLLHCYQTIIFPHLP